MKTAEQNAKPASTPKTGGLATLASLLHLKNGGTPARGGLIVAALALLAVVTVGPSAAQAKQARLFAGTFGGASSTTFNPYPLGVNEGGGPRSIAVDTVAGPSQGDVYVTDAVNHRVEKFDSSGHFLLMFGKEVNKTAVEESATRSAEENICPAAGHPADVCQPGATTASPGALEKPEYIAVDNSSGFSQGDVYVDAGSGTEPKDEEQQLELTGATGGTFTLTFEGQTTQPISVQSEDLRREVLIALEELSSLGSSSVNVNGGGDQIRIRFNGARGATNVPQLTVNASGLVPGSATAKVSTPIEGGPGTPDAVTKFTPEGDLLESWGVKGQLDGSTVTGGPFINLMGLAVDSSGNLWVLRGSQPRAFEFGQDASFLTEWSIENAKLGFGAYGSGSAVDPEDNLYYGTPSGLLKVSASGTPLGVVNGISLLQGFTVDLTHNELFLATEAFAGPTEVQRYLGSACHPSGTENPCSPAETFGQGRLEQQGGPYRGLAVDSSSPADKIYVLGARGQVTAFAVETVPDVATVKASGFTTTTATLNGAVEPEGVPTTQCFFEWGATTAYGNRAPCAQGEVLTGSGKDQVSAEITGLTPGQTYHFRLVVSNASTDLAEEPSRGADLAFGPPLVLGTSAFGVSAASAILQTELNANNVETHYHFEYDTVPYAEGEGPHGISVPVPDASLGSGAAVVTASKQIEGLAPATVYYYRVVATNTLGDTDGPDGSFSTQSAIYGPPLLDDRAWEMVSPPQKSGSGIRGIDEAPGGVLQAAADGGGIAFAANGSFGQEAPGDRSFQSSQFLAFRGANGWSTKDVTTPREDVVGVIVGNTEAYKAFSQDLSFGAVQPRGFTPLSPLATETTPYLRAANGEFLPLVDSLDVPPETVFDGKITGLEGIPEHEPEIVGGSPDLHSVVIASCFKLTEDAVNLCSKGGNSLFVWHEG
ncbi:MAG: hypothetical protein WAU42_04370, partial [Solirubrobacteraceae bacterium]